LSSHLHREKIAEITSWDAFTSGTQEKAEALDGRENMFVIRRVAARCKA
jgi:hypothetical protein